MPWNRCTSPSKLYRDAQRRLHNARRTQKKQQIHPVPDSNKYDPSGSGSEGGKAQEQEEPRNTDKEKEVVQPTTSIEHLVNVNGLTSLRDTSKILTMLKSEPTYCLTGSKVFWTIDEEVAPTGTWRP